MKILKVHNKLEEVAITARLMALTLFFFLSNKLDIEWSLINSVVILVAGIPTSIILGDFLGLLLGGIYLCRTGKAGEVDRWSRFSAIKMPWRIRAQAYLKGYSKRWK